jgi:hypothetical protein
MYAIVVASHSGFALNVLRSLTGVVTGVAVVGEISRLWRIAHWGKFVAIDLDESEANVKLLAQAVNKIAAAHTDCVAVPADTIAGAMLIAGMPSLDCAIYPSSSRGLLQAYEDKWLFYGLCSEHGISTPKTLLLGKKDGTSFRQLVQFIQPPFLVKPTNRMGTEGVVFVSGPDEYDAQVLYNSAYQYSPLIAQEFIPGRDIDISILALRGKIMCSAVQIKTGGVVRFLEHNRLFSVVEQLVRETEYTGLCHFDAREHGQDGSIWLVDANPRFWGSLDAARWCGLNFAAAGLALALKRPIDEPATLTEGCYCGLPAALLSMFSGRLDRTERGRQQRVFLRNILSDPSEYAIGLKDGVSHLGKQLFSQIRRVGTKLRTRLQEHSQKVSGPLGRLP